LSMMQDVVASHRNNRTNQVDGEFVGSSMVSFTIELRCCVVVVVVVVTLTLPKKRTRHIRES
jgi:hypothetical protein